MSSPIASSIFAALLKCDECSHPVEGHEADGCTMAACSCRQTREAAIEMNVMFARRERRRRS